MGARDSGIARAWKLFRAFHRRAPRRGELLELACVPVVALEVGAINRIDYESKSEPGVARFHIFAKQSRPVLFVSFDGSQAYILAGGYRFTPRGLEG